MLSQLNVAVEAARKAGGMIRRAVYGHRPYDVTQKGPNDYVTSVDLIAEQIIIEAIQKTYPEHCFLSEEAGFIKGTDEDAVWIIDPLDGTNNFIHGLPHFAVVIGFQLFGEMKCSVVYNPMTDQLFTTIKGKSAQLNDRRIRVSDHIHIEGSLLSPATTRSVRFNETYEQRLMDLSKKTVGIRHSGSVALDLAYVAAGFLDGMWRVNMKDWDLHPAALLAQEAGALITNLEGGVNYQESGDVVVANPKLVRKLVGMLKGCFNTDI